MTLQLWKHAAHNISSRFLPQFKVLLKSSRGAHTQQTSPSLFRSLRLAVISRDTYLQAGRSAHDCVDVFLCWQKAPSTHPRALMAQGAPSLPPFDPKKSEQRRKKYVPAKSNLVILSVRALFSGQLADTLKFRRSRPTALRRWLSSIRLNIYNAAAAAVAAFPDSGEAARRSQLELINSLRATRLRESCGRS